MSTTAFASEKVEKTTIPTVITVNDLDMDADLNAIDLAKPYTETKTYADSDGNPIILNLSYEPTRETKGSSSNPASTGTWTSSVNMGVISMSYQFDVDRSGTQWTISNGREHAYSGLFCKFNNDKLNISRSTSTNSYAAEINASVHADVFDNAWIPLYSGTWLMTTTINSSGTMTLT